MNTRRRIVWVVVVALALILGVLTGSRAQAMSPCDDGNFAGCGPERCTVQQAS